MEQLSFADAAPTVFSVTSLTAAIHRVVALNFDDVRVTGEISGYKVWSSGHAYFTLKDSSAQIRCVVFRNVARYLKFRPEDGLAVMARGSVEVRQERGEYQLVVSSLEPQGLGALQLAFEQLKQRLAAEGLFAAERKRALPPYPRRIGIVTSPQGAVIRDMITVLSRRFSGLHIRLYPTPVQGDGAAEGIREGLRYFGESGWADLIIVGRGGGSLEDLWPFNEEEVARAIVASPVPVISAVGHETDFTIADFVADLRAPTPSAAAELAVKNREDLLDTIDITWERIWRAMHYRIAHAARQLHDQGMQRASVVLQRRIGRNWQRVDEAEQRLRGFDPRVRLGRARQRLEASSQRLQEAMRRLVRGSGQRVDEAGQRLTSFDPRVRLGWTRQRLETASQSLEDAIGRRVNGFHLRLHPVAARLEALSPLSVLERGYSILTTDEGRVVKSPEDAPPGTSVEARLARGRLRATVREETAERD